MMSEKNHCPICAEEITGNWNFPKQVCERCRNKASDAYGRRLSFSNQASFGCFKIFYRDNGTEYQHQICYIDGRKCFASEHRFGGVILEVVN